LHEATRKGTFYFALLRASYKLSSSSLTDSRYKETERKKEIKVFVNETSNPKEDEVGGVFLQNVVMTQCRNESNKLFNIPIILNATRYSLSAYSTAQIINLDREQVISTHIQMTFYMQLTRNYEKQFYE